MNKRNFSIPRLAIFFVGLVFLTIIFQVVQPNYLSVTWRGPFINVILVLIYIGYGLPLVFRYFEEMKAGGFFVGGALYYRGLRLYTAINLVLIALIATTLLPLKFAIIVELVSIFVFIIYTYMSMATSQHIVNVGEQEKAKVATLKYLKQKVMELQVKTSAMSGDRSDIRERCAKLADNLNYLSPSDNEQALQLESRLLDAVTYLVVSDMTPGKEADSIIRQQLAEIETLYQMRKNIY